MKDMKNIDSDINEFNKIDAQSKLEQAKQYICQENQDFNKFMISCKMSALQGNAHSQYIMGIFYEDGIEGLEKYFKQNKKHYTWSEPRYKGFVVKCKDEATAKSLKKAIKKLNPDSVANYIRTQVNNDSITFASVERGLWKQGENGYVDLTEFKAPNAEVTIDEKLPITIVAGKMLKKPETYTDVRGAITADYQNYLEKKWIENLRNKYKIEINQETLNSLR